MTARILIVDDAPAAQALKARLTLEYYQVETARDTPAALRLA